MRKPRDPGRALTRWGRRRQARQEKLVVDAIKAGNRYGNQLYKATGLRSALYPTLLRLEDKGIVSSAFQDGQPPRRRVYWLRNTPMRPLG